jgi:Protein of unknown function (DUF3309)
LGTAAKTLRHQLGKAKRGKHMLVTILLVVLVMMLLGVLPKWPHSRQWGYVPSSGVGLILIVVVILLLLGRI